ncbi:MAG: hypothetical protein H7222_02825 [Methylotenera sp.]|nr:hypothetical protein [Oligoflexia bacterium]
MNALYKRFRMTGILSIFSLMLCVSLAWGETTHQVTGQIAASHLAARRSPAAMMKDGHTLRVFLGEVLKISGHSEAVQANEMRAIIGGTPDLFRWLSDAGDLDRVLDESGMRAALGAGLEANHLQKSISQSLSKHLDSMVNGWAGPYAAQARVLFPNGAAQPLNQSVINAALFTVSQLPVADRARLLVQVQDSEFLDLTQSFKNSAENLQVDKIEVLKQMSSANFVKGDDSQEANAAIQELLGDYFKSMPIESKLALLADFLALAPEARPAEQLKTVLFHTDPFLQKLFQLLGRDMENPVLEEAFASLQNGMKPISFEEFKSIVDARLGEPTENVFVDFQPKMYRASTGIVAIATVKKTGQRVAIKVQVPGAKRKFEEAATRMLDFPSVRANPGMREMIRSTGLSIAEEFDYLKEILNLQRAGEIYDRPDLGISVPKVVEGLPQFSDFMVSTFATGVKPTTLTAEKDLVKRARLTGNLIKLWIDTALFGVGRTMFHGDMHPGNQNMDLQLGPKGTDTLMDLGAVGWLELEERRGLVNVFNGCLIGNPGSVVSALERVTGQQLASNSRLLKIIDEQFLFSKEPAERLETILGRGMNEAGVQVPKSFVAFIRAVRFLVGDVESVNAALKKVDPTFSKYQRLDFGVLAKEAIVSRLSSDLPRQVVSSLMRQQSTVTLKMMTDFSLGYSKLVLKKWFSCDTLFKKHGPLKLTE